jgi:hypothetical protein
MVVNGPVPHSWTQIYVYQILYIYIIYHISISLLISHIHVGCTIIISYPYKGWPDGNQKWPMWSPIDTNIWGFPEMGIAGYPNSWLVYNGTSENKLDDLGAPPWHRKSSILWMEENLHQLKTVVYPIIHRVSTIQGGAGFLPSTVWKGYNRNNQQHGDYLGMFGNKVASNLHLNKEHDD